jgi:TolA-binding protein
MARSGNTAGLLFILEAETVKKLGLLAAGSLLLVAFPQIAASKPSVLKIQPEGSQLAAMESGAQIVTSQMAGSIIVMRTPEPFDGKRTRIFFTFVNNGQFPVNVGPENVTSTQVAVVSYDQLIAEQKRSEGLDKFFAAMGAVGKALSATDAGNQSTVTSYSGYANCGIGCGGTYSGSAVSRTYSPYAAQQAQAQAAAENAAAASEMHSGHASERNAIARNLQTTTVNPGQFLTGMLTFEVPNAVRRGKKATPITLAIRVGSDVHMLRGYAGPLSAPPPAVSSIAAIERPATGNAFEDGYTYGYRLWEAKLYRQAQATLEETLATFPGDERASYARNLLGRAWLDDKKPATAVKVFYENYKTDPRGARAPDSLFFLGAALTDIGKAAEACEAFSELAKSYPDEVTDRLADRLKSGNIRAKCKPDIRKPASPNPQPAPATTYASATLAPFSATEFLSNLPKPKD